MSIADWILPNRTDPDSRKIQDALKDYFLLKSADDAAESFSGRIFGDDSHDLSNENQRLDIELKKRQLSAMGPQDTSMFNDTPAPRILAALGINWAKDFQPSARAGIGASKDSGLFKIGSSFGSEAKELGNVTRSVGSAGGGGLGSLASRIFRSAG